MGASPTPGTNEHQDNPHDQHQSVPAGIHPAGGYRHDFHSRYQHRNTAAAQSESSPTDLTAIPLRNGLWLEWTPGTGCYSHQQIYFYPGNSKRLPSGEPILALAQDEKARAAYGFIPYSDLGWDALYWYRIDAMRNRSIAASSPLDYTFIPAGPHRGDLPLTPPARATIHPGGLQARFSASGDRITFSWTPGIDPAYREHALVCRQKSDATTEWQTLHTDTEVVNVVQRKSHTVLVSDDVFPPGHEHICRVTARDGPRGHGPMTNKVVIDRR